MVRQKPRNMVQPVIVSGFHSSAIESVDHDALWLVVVNEVRQPGAYAPICCVSECDGHMGKKLWSKGSTQHVYVREQKVASCSSRWNREPT